jgi:leader peptidase (prepilin peptidase)/N-methyltransferase
MDFATVAVAVNHFTAFIFGAAVGSFLNVCVYRIPYEKSFLWPGSRCGNCYQPIRFYDNIPLLSYWLLRGRCRRCGAHFSMRYFLVELGTALAFAGLYHLEVYRNALDIPLLASSRERWAIMNGVPSSGAWTIFVYHSVLLSFLIAASVCDIEHLEIPLGITVAGTIVGLIGSACFPWPFPNTQLLPDPVPFLAGPNREPAAPSAGLYLWPVWTPLPGWLPKGSWQLGLATGLAGAAAGNIVLRIVRFVFQVGRGIEGLGIGDSDLMMMAGSFVGWQVIVVAFPAGVFAALFVAIGQWILRGKEMLPFGPSLAIGVMLTLLCWRFMAKVAWNYLSDAPTVAAIGILCAAGLFVCALALRFLRGNEPPEELEASEKAAG